MSTTRSTLDVKRFLKEKIRDELVPALEQLVDELPNDLVGFSDAEQLLRGRFLKLAGSMLQGWTEVATTRIAIPPCPTCGKPMRHKGLKPCTLTTTLGDVRLRRPRYRCMHCKTDIYPHDQHIRFCSCSSPGARRGRARTPQVGVLPTLARIATKFTPPKNS